ARPLVRALHGPLELDLLLAGLRDLEVEGPALGRAALRELERVGGPVPVLRLREGVHGEPTLHEAEELLVEDVVGRVAPVLLVARAPPGELELRLALDDEIALLLVAVLPLLGALAFALLVALDLE